MVSPDLDSWVPDATIRVSHQVPSQAPPPRLWDAARAVRLRDTRLLGRLVRWRIPGVPVEASFEELLGQPPFMVLDQGELHLVSGIVGRIWTIRRDYPVLDEPDDFRHWRRAGTARVVFANWVQPDDGAGSLLRSETRVEAFGVQGRIGVGSVRPLIRAFQGLVVTDAMATAVRRAAEGG